MESKTILIIEDDEKIAEILQINLEIEGFSVLTAENGKVGFDKAVKLRPDLITLDVLMPEKSGWEALADLKDDPRTRDIPVVMITVVQDAQKAFELGACYYISKPFRFDNLLEVINDQLRC